MLTTTSPSYSSRLCIHVDHKKAIYMVDWTALLMGQNGEQAQGWPRKMV